ncbi:M48 family metalloprotease [Crenobacter sp. SG2303]|uniref:M48 family metalloprotease n=1 Tax=Crenobacter oryzisoli TaxID=3056844 RepID=A0ABT7XHZ3_9NEIS|nr:M48 family metalloprotease [Crenobacter sp. SG2303]MDN0073397.1 M48 family metalloprotease [Crenobacter sp. SG2303]
MKTTRFAAVLSLSLALAPAAHAIDFSQISAGLAVGKQALKAATLSDSEVKTLADQACAQYDRESKIAPANSKYGKRLAAITKKVGKEINGQPVNFKVYQNKEVNAWAMANGCVRINTGLMDKMNDDEVIGVIGHEMGHVALGHTKKAMQVAYTAAAARNAAGTFGGEGLAQLSNSELGELGEALVNAQFSQSQESDADNFSYDLLAKKSLDRRALLTAFQKLAAQSGDDRSMLSSHPASSDRAKNIESRLAKDGI